MMLLISMLVVLIATGILLFINDKTRNIAPVVLIVGFLVAMFICFSSLWSAVGNCKGVLTVVRSGHEQFRVFYDENANTYFYITDTMNPFKQFKRVYLDTEECEEYLERYNALQEINLFD